MRENPLSLAGRISLAWARVNPFAPAKSAGGVFDLAGHGSLSFGVGGASTARRSNAALLQAYDASPWLRAVASKIMHAVGQTRWYLLAGTEGEAGSAYKRYVRRPDLQRGPWSCKAGRVPSMRAAGELDEISDHPYFEVVWPSSGVLLGTDVLAITQLYLDLTGEAFWLKRYVERDGVSTLVRVWPVPPTWVTMVPDAHQDRFVVSSQYLQGSFGRDEMVWFRYPSPADPYGRGVGFAGALADELETDEYTSKHLKMHFTNQARPDMLVSVEGATEAERRLLEATWLQRLQGYWRAKRPFFTGRKIDVQEFGQTFQEMQLTDLRRFERDVIIHAWGMPPEILGILEGSNRATITAASHIFAKWLVLPRLEFLRRVLQPAVVEEYDERLILGFDSPVEADKTHLLAVGKAAPWSVMLDEWRAMQDLEPVGGVRGRSVVMAPNQVFVELEPQEEPEVPAAEPESEGRAVPCGCGAHPSQPEAPLPYRVRAVPDIDGQEILEALERLGPELEAEVLAALDTIRRRMDVDDVLDILKSGNIEAALDAAGIDDLPEGLAGALAVVERALAVAGEGAAEAFSALAGVEVGFDITNPEAVAWLAENGAELVTNATRGTKDAIRLMLEYAYEEGLTGDELARMLLNEGLGLQKQQARAAIRLTEKLVAEGLPTDEVVKRVSQYIDQARRYRAKLIADNELTNAGNKGQELLWDDAVGKGLIDPETTVRVWILSAAPCKNCEPMAGATAPIGGVWYTPLGPVATPSDIHIRCRCGQGLLFLGGKGRIREWSAQKTAAS